MSTNNITQITPGAAKQITEAVRWVQRRPLDARGTPNPANSVNIPGQGKLPTGTGKYKVWQIIDDLSPGTTAFDYAKFH